VGVGGDVPEAAVLETTSCCEESPPRRETAAGWTLIRETSAGFGGGVGSPRGGDAFLPGSLASSGAARSKTDARVSGSPPRR
jgi:hypothetical protein